MGWLRKRRYELDLDALNAEVMFRIRGLFLDSQLNDSFSLSVIAGTSLVSEEVAEREQEESQKRIARVAHLYPMIFAHTYQIAKATAELQKTKFGDAANELDDAVWESLFETTQQIAMASVVGSLSQMVDLNLLTVGPRKPRK